jgi:hypothetical protein
MFDPYFNDTLKMSNNGPFGVKWQYAKCKMAK